MALIWAESFDHYGTATEGLENMQKGAWDYINGNVTLSNVQARTGQLSLRIEQQGGRISEVRRVFPGAGRDTIGLAMGIYMPSLPPDGSGPHGVHFRTATGGVLRYYFRPDGSIEFLNTAVSPNISLGATDAGVLVAGAFIHLEIAAYIHPVTGWIEVRREGVTVYRAEELPLSDQLITNMTIGASTTGAFGFHAFYDDIVACDGTGDSNRFFVGPCRVLTMFADADTEVAEWNVEGAASGYEAVNEVPPDGDTSYIEAEDVGDRVEFELPDLPPEVIGVQGVYVPTMGRLDDAGVGRIRVSLVNSDSQAEEGPEIPFTPAYTYYGSPFETNPATNTFWTKEELEAARVRIEKTM